MRWNQSNKTYDGWKKTFKNEIQKDYISLKSPG